MKFIINLAKNYIVVYKKREREDKCQRHCSSLNVFTTEKILIVICLLLVLRHKIIKNNLYNKIS